MTTKKNNAPLKAFLIVLGIGAGLFAMSSISSLLGSMASEKSDAGIVAGGILVIVIVAAGVALITKYLSAQENGPDQQENEE